MTATAGSNDSQLLRIGIAGLERRLGVERSTISRWTRAGTFPRPHYIASLRRWWLHEIEAWELAQAGRSVHERRFAARDLEDAGDAS